MVKRALIFFHLIALLLGVPRVGEGRVIDPRLRWRTFRSAHFYLHFYEQERSIAEKVLPILEKTFSSSLMK